MSLFDNELPEIPKVTLPPGWRVDESMRHHDRLMFVLKDSTGPGCITVDLKQRTWDLGVHLQGRITNPIPRGWYGGPHWLQTLANDALSYYRQQGGSKVMTADPNQIDPELLSNVTWVAPNTEPEALKPGEVCVMTSGPSAVWFRWRLKDGTLIDKDYEGTWLRSVEDSLRAQMESAKTFKPEPPIPVYCIPTHHKIRVELVDSYALKDFLDLMGYGHACYRVLPNGSPLFYWFSSSCDPDQDILGEFPDMHITESRK